MSEYPRFTKKDQLARNQKAAQEAKGISGHHIEDLYDMKEDVYGNKVNEATGRPIDNTKNEGNDERLSITEPGDKDALPSIREKDAADEWLRKNDPEYGK